LKSQGCGKERGNIIRKLKINVSENFLKIALNVENMFLFGVKRSFEEEKVKGNERNG
jgi:hypothetical protein